MLQLVLRCLKTIVKIGRFMNRIDFYTALKYEELSERCWRLYQELKRDFVGYERLADLLCSASIEFNEKLEKLLSDGEDNSL